MSSHNLQALYKQDVAIFSMTFDEKISDSFCEISLWDRISLKDIFSNGKPLQLETHSYFRNS